MENLSAILHFSPILKSVIWGGKKIAALKSIPDAPDYVGESWEVSAVPGSPSVVDRGPLAGQNLIDLTAAFPLEMLGQGVISRNHNSTAFPLLIKIIDAQGNLSIQVHPDDEMAPELHPGRFGKTEMWHILDSEPEAKILIGLNGPFSPQEYEEAIADNSIMSHINSFESASGETFFIPAGRIHAIGAGNLLLEVQQSSDITYRIYDYNRLDKNGNPRELHTALAKRAINFNDCNPADCAPTQPAPDGTLASCPYFNVKRIALSHTPQPLALDSDSFLIVTAIEGEATLCAGSERMLLPKGDTVLIPAQYASTASAAGPATIILTHA